MTHQGLAQPSLLLQLPDSVWAVGQVKDQGQTRFIRQRLQLRCKQSRIIPLAQITCGEQADLQHPCHAHELSTKDRRYQQPTLINHSWGIGRDGRGSVLPRSHCRPTDPVAADSATAAGGVAARAGHWVRPWIGRRRSARHSNEGSLRACEMGNRARDLVGSAAAVDRHTGAEDLRQRTRSGSWTRSRSGWPLGCWSWRRLSLMATRAPTRCGSWSRRTRSVRPGRDLRLGPLTEAEYRTAFDVRLGLSETALPAGEAGRHGEAPRPGEAPVPPGTGVADDRRAGLNPSFERHRLRNLCGCPQGSGGAVRRLSGVRPARPRDEQFPDVRHHVNTEQFVVVTPHRRGAGHPDPVGGVHGPFLRGAPALRPERPTLRGSGATPRSRPGPTSTRWAPAASTSPSRARCTPPCSRGGTQRMRPPNITDEPWTGRRKVLAAVGIVRSVWPSRGGVG